jgi:hypothetical protein
MKMADDLNARIEEAALNAWPATRQMVYDGWLLRFAGGYTKRANSVNVHAPSSLPLEEKINFCEKVYTEQGLPLIFRLPEFLTPPELYQALEMKGYSLFDQTLVLGREISIGEKIPEGCEAEALPIDAWIDLRSKLTGTPISHWKIHRSILNVIVPQKALMGLSFEGRPVACGLAVLEGGLLGYFSIYTAESARRRGFGQAMMHALTDWGIERGAVYGYLQVEGDNLTAQAMYQKLGFTTCYRYSYSKRF